MTRLYAGHPSLKYLLYYVAHCYVAHCADVADADRQRAQAATAGQFALHELVKAELGTGPVYALIVQNIAHRQGDEIIRVVPLLEALLSFNPQLEIVLITKRTYLYTHSRITLVPIDDRDGVRSVLRDRFDLVVDFCEPNLPELTYDRRLELEIQARARSQPPLLWVAANKGWNHFVYQRVDLKERAYADRLGLNRQRVENIYETTLRLIAELGRPPRLGQTPPETDSVLAGLPCPEAEAAWAELVRPNRRDRPVALVCPFGGAEPLKGYVERQADLLAEQLRALIEEGLYVVLQPNGMPWGSAGHARNGRQPPDAVRAGPGRGCA